MLSVESATEREGKVKEGYTAMQKQHERAQSYLFTIRMWQEEVGPDTVEWRGKVQLVTGGEVRYFREWTTLVPLLQIMLAQTGAVKPDGQEAD